MDKYTKRILKHAGARKQMAQGKISERLIEFAGPMLDQAIKEVGPDITDEQLRVPLNLASLIWNSVVAEQTGRSNEFAKEAMRLLSNDGNATPVMDITLSMFERKRKYFSNDLRYIGEVRVFRDAAGARRVEAKAALEGPLWDEQ